ncbi:MAG: hypothetical protein RI957_1924 [Verrucomicrobiota bacterium]|jgi:hypothetical protein
MKTTFFMLAVCGLVCAQETPKKDTAAILSEHFQGSKKTSGQQDELAADVQQLRIEQTNPKVITLLDEVETIMDEASENLDDANTGGETIAAQTEVIEKIFEAAKQKQQGQGQGQSQGAQGMMEMMKRMMGQGAEGDEKKPGNQPGNKPGDGQKGDSDTANSANQGKGNGDKAEERRVPKASGANAQEFPEEFRKALDAYNRAVSP